MSFKRSLLYGLANLSYFLGYSTFNTYVLFFYTDHLQMSVRLISRGWFLFGFWNTINDLLFGWLADRVPSRLGRRTFFILIFSIPVGLSFFLTWSPPNLVLDVGDTAVFWYFLIIISIYDMLQTAVNISQGAAFPEIAIRSDVRAKIAAIRQVLGILGMVLGVAISPLIYDKGGWGLMGVAWGSLITMMYILSLFGIRGREIAPVPTVREDGGWRKSVGLIFTNFPFLTFLAFSFVVRFALACLTTVMPFYVEYVLGLSPSQLSSVLGVLLGSAILALPIWPRLIERLEPRGAGILVMFYLTFLLLPFLFVSNLASALVLAVLIGPAYGGSTVVLDLLYAQIVDADFVRVGRSRAGVFSGIIGTMLRFSPALAGLVLGELLAAARYNPELSVQPASVAPALRVLMVAMPGVALMLGGILLFLYPIHGQRLTELHMQVRHMRREKRLTDGPDDFAT